MRASLERPRIILSGTCAMVMFMAISAGRDPAKPDFPDAFDNNHVMADRGLAFGLEHGGEFVGIHPGAFGQPRSEPCCLPGGEKLPN